MEEFGEGSMLSQIMSKSQGKEGRGQLDEMHEDTRKFYEWLGKAGISELKGFDFSTLQAFEAVRMRERIETLMEEANQTGNFDGMSELIEIFDRFQLTATYDSDEFFRGIREDAEVIEKISNASELTWEGFMKAIDAEFRINNTVILGGSMLDSIIGADGDLRVKLLNILDKR